MSIPEASPLTGSSYLTSLTTFASSAVTKVTSLTSSISKSIFSTLTNIAGHSCKAVNSSCKALSSLSGNRSVALKTGVAALAILGIGYAVKANLPRIKAILPK